MKNKFVKEILIFSVTIVGIFLFFISSKSSFSPNTEVTIKLNENISNQSELRLINDLKSITSVSNVDISNDTDVIVLEVDNQIFDSIPVEKTLDKWEVDYEKEFDIYIIADAQEF